MDEVEKRRCRTCGGEVDHHWSSDDYGSATYFVGKILVGELAGHFAAIDVCPTCASHGLITALTVESTEEVVKKAPKKNVKKSKRK